MSEEKEQELVPIQSDQMPDMEESSWLLDIPTPRPEISHAGHAIEHGPQPQKRAFLNWLTSIVRQINLLVVAIIFVSVIALLLLILEFIYRPGNAASKDILSLTQLLFSWPIVVALALLLFYKPLTHFLESSGRNVQTVKVSALPFALEVSKASATQFTPAWSDAFTGVDLRLTAADEVMSSNMPALFEQFKDNASLDYALIDIGDGKRWLTSRLFIFAIMLERMRGLRCLVFVETTSDAQQRFLGTASPRELRWKLATLHPWLEPSLAQASYLMQYLGNVPDPPKQPRVQAPAVPSNPHFIRSTHGALDPSAAETLVRAFLKDPNIQQKSQPVTADGNWEEITRPNKPPFWEHANWIDRTWLHKRGDIIDRNAYRKISPDDSPAEQTQAILRRQGPFIALVDADKQFEDLVDRHILLETVIANLRQQLDDKTQAT